MKKEKAQSKKQEEVNEAPAPSAPATKTSRKPIVIEEENSESVWNLKNMIISYHLMIKKLGWLFYVKNNHKFICTIKIKQ